MGLNPVVAFFRTHVCLLTGRLHFPRQRVGERIALPDGRRYRIFRQVRLDPGPGRPATPGAIFIPRFRVAGMAPRLNILFSLLPIPFFVGLPGFRSKLWLIHEETGDFAGLYEWETVRDAENYARSFAMHFMSRRSVPGSVSCQVISREEWQEPPVVKAEGTASAV